MPKWGEKRKLWLRGIAVVVGLLVGLGGGLSCGAVAQEKSAGASNTVVADGVGATRDEAMKDAYRNAVRQVVGLYVDAESLVKNDELLDDKVLTYSDGFITKAEVVAGSEKKQGSLVRLKVRATVERKSLVAKLKAANFTVKSLDGESLFAKAITEIDSEKDATTLLKKALADLPTMLTADVVGKPDYDKEKEEIVVNVRVQSDRKAYAAFTKRLMETLEKVSVAKDTISINAEPLLVRGRDGQQNVHDGGFINRNQPALGGPKLKNGNQWGVWVNTFNNASHSTTKWSVYTVEADMKAIVPMLEVPSAWGPDTIFRPSDAKTLLVLSAFDADGNLVTEYETELIADRRAAFNVGNSSDGILPLLRHFTMRKLDGANAYNTHGSVSAALRFNAFKDPSKSVNLYLSPYALAAENKGDGWSLAYYPSLPSTQRFKATLDELKQIRELKCEVKYKPARD